MGSFSTVRVESVYVHLVFVYVVGFFTEVAVCSLVYCKCNYFCFVRTCLKGFTFSVVHRFAATKNLEIHVYVRYY